MASKIVIIFVIIAVACARADMSSQIVGNLSPDKLMEVVKNGPSGIMDMIKPFNVLGIMKNKDSGDSSSGSNDTFFDISIIKQIFGGFKVPGFSQD